MEGDVYYPSEEIVAQARLKDWEARAEKGGKDLQGFWADEASELEWYKKWDKVLDDSNKPFYKWFVGGRTVNIVHNAIDRHLKTHRKNQLWKDIVGIPHVHWVFGWWEWSIIVLFMLPNVWRMKPWSVLKMAQPLKGGS